MGKYYVDWNDICPEEAGILIDAVARYASVNEYPEIRDVLAILGIKKKEDKEKESIWQIYMKLTMIYWHV